MATYDSSSHITFDKVVETLKARQRPESHFDLLSSLLGLGGRGGGADVGPWVEIIQSKIGQSLTAAKTQARDINRAVHQQPWKYMTIVLGVGVLGGVALSAYHQAHRVRLNET